MNYLKFTKDDMLNGRGVRLTLWVAGCNHECPKCQNPETWDPNVGKLFTTLEGDNILRELSKDYINIDRRRSVIPRKQNNIDVYLRSM